MQYKQIYQCVVAHRMVASVCHCHAIATTDAWKLGIRKLNIHVIKNKVGNVRVA
jgi:hypothetical protein